MKKRLKKFNVQAHRCFGGEKAANSMEAFIAAVKSGIHSIETDVFLSKDDVLYIIHGDNDYGVCEFRELDNPDDPWQLYTIGDGIDYYIEAILRSSVSPFIP